MHCRRHPESPHAPVALPDVCALYLALERSTSRTEHAGCRGRGGTAGGPQGDDKVSGHSCSNAVGLHPVRGSGVPEEALVGVHVQVAAVAGHLVKGMRMIARLPPQALHTDW